MRAVLLVCLVAPALFLAFSSIPPAHAAGILFIAPSSQPAQAVGSMLSYEVNVTGMDPFDSWDVSVKSDPAVLNPVSISVANSILGSVIEVANCVNGVGSGCLITDGAGVAHSGGAASSGVGVGGAGLVFTITYKVVGSGFSFLKIPTGLDTIGSSGVFVSHSNIGGVYGTPPILPIAVFTFSPVAPNQGDKVTFDGSSSTDANTGATIVNYAWTISLRSGGTTITNMTSQPLMVHTFGAAEVGTFSVTLIVEDNLGISSQPTSHEITVGFNFNLSVPSPSSLTVVQGSTSSTSSIDATFVSGPTAPVTFSASALPAGVTATFTHNQCNPTCTVTVSFAATANAALGATTVSIRAAGDGASRLTALSLTVSAPTPSVDFTFSPASPTVGDTVSFRASVSSGNTPYTYSWDFGDGSTGSGATPTHVFSASGSHAVALSVSDYSTPHVTGKVTHAVNVAQGGSPSFAATLTSPPSLTGIAIVIILIIAGLAYVRSRGRKPVI